MSINKRLTNADAVKVGAMILDSKGDKTAEDIVRSWNATNERKIGTSQVRDLAYSLKIALKQGNGNIPAISLFAVEKRVRILEEKISRTMRELGITED